jgi:hypothetical protein
MSRPKIVWTSTTQPEGCASSGEGNSAGCIGRRLRRPGFPIVSPLPTLTLLAHSAWRAIGLNARLSPPTTQQPLLEGAGCGEQSCHNRAYQILPTRVIPQGRRGAQPSHHAVRPQSGGGCQPAVTQFRRTVTATRWFRWSATTVARPVAVRPTTIVPSALH